MISQLSFANLAKNIGLTKPVLFSSSGIVANNSDLPNQSMQLGSIENSKQRGALLSAQAWLEL